MASGNRARGSLADQIARVSEDLRHIVERSRMDDELAAPEIDDAAQADRLITTWELASLTPDEMWEAALGRDHDDARAQEAIRVALEAHFPGWTSPQDDSVPPLSGIRRVRAEHPAMHGRA